MTAQLPDVLIVRGQRLNLYAQPLYPYLRKLPRRRRPGFSPPGTHLYRGYIATWEIRDGALWLLDLEGCFRQGEEWIDGGLVDAMPWLRPPVLATWVSDRLRCPEGVMCSYAHHPFRSQFERDRTFDIVAGKLEGEWLVINPPPSVEYVIDPDGSRRLHEFELTDNTLIADLYLPEETPAGERFWAAEAEALRREAGKGEMPHVMAATLFGTRPPP